MPIDEILDRIREIKAVVGYISEEDLKAGIDRLISDVENWTP
jgi:hypothetical protein